MNRDGMNSRPYERESSKVPDLRKDKYGFAGFWLVAKVVGQGARPTKR
ncbi:MAG: hypothetical protein MUO85_08790 [candidate division Zixibacteria bacterium]|nr:hypothetical protein [candidate division Zixibacteria bacterium]